MKIRLRLLLIVLLILLLGLLLYFILRQQKLKHNSKINQIEQDVSLVSSETVAPINYRSQYTAERLIRGYVDSYDSATHSITVRYRLTTRAKEESTTYPLALDQVVYCWPERQNGVDIATAFIPLTPQSLIYLKNEQAVLVKDLTTELNGKYVFIQTNELNQVLKLAIVACYD